MFTYLHHKLYFTGSYLCASFRMDTSWSHTRAAFLFSTRCEVSETGGDRTRPRTRDPTRHRPNSLVLSLGTSSHFVSYRSSSWDLPVFEAIARTVTHNAVARDPDIIIFGRTGTATFTRRSNVESGSAPQVSSVSVGPHFHDSLARPARAGKLKTGAHQVPVIRFADLAQTLSKSSHLRLVGSNLLNLG
jgi:hypothetical protein